MGCGKAMIILLKTHCSYTLYVAPSVTFFLPNLTPDSMRMTGLSSSGSIWPASAVSSATFPASRDLHSPYQGKSCIVEMKWLLTHNESSYMNKKKRMLIIFLVIPLYGSAICSHYMALTWAFVKRPLLSVNRFPFTWLLKGLSIAKLKKPRLKKLNATNFIVIS